MIPLDTLTRAYWNASTLARRCPGHQTNGINAAIYVADNTTSTRLYEAANQLIKDTANEYRTYAD